MQPKRHPTEDLFLHPVFLAWSAATAVSARRDRREERGLPRRQGGEGQKAVAPAARHAVGPHLAALRQPLSLVDMRTAYAAFLREAVTAITLVWRRRTRRLTARPAKA
jgi:hypothetical protein